MARDARIEVVFGNGLGRRLEVPVGARASIGRTKPCDLLIPDDDAVSKRHLELENGPTGLLLTVVGKNGVKVDGTPIPKTGVILVHPSRLEIGGATLRVTFAKKPVPPPGLVLERWLGSGASGSVYAGRLRGKAEPVSIKVLDNEAGEPDVLARFRREAELQKRLAHPSIVRVHGLLENEGQLFLVRELIEGHVLEDELPRGALPPRRALALGATLAAALAHAHAHGVVHRDVAPPNIFIEDGTGAVKLGDFGLAREVGQRATMDGTFVTKTSDSFGSFYYVAPEQAGSAKDAGPPADVYGLGAVLYHALSGVRPFADVRMDDFMRAVYRGVEPLERVAPGVPPSVSRAVMRAMNPLHEERPDAASFARELAKLGASA